MGNVYYQIIKEGLQDEAILEICEAEYWAKHFTFPDDETKPILNGINIDEEILSLSEEFELGLTLTSPRVYAIPQETIERLDDILHNHTDLQFEEYDLEFLNSDESEEDAYCEETWIDDYWNSNTKLPTQMELDY